MTAVLQRRRAMEREAEYAAGLEYRWHLERLRQKLEGV